MRHSWWMVLTALQALGLAAVSVHAQTVPEVLAPTNAAETNTPPPAIEIHREFLGSGEPGQTGFENALLVTNDAYHAPQYMPGYPTARPVWARAIEVPCSRSVDGRLQCKGYQWLPSMGRAEYLFFRPVILADAVAPAAAVTPVPSVTESAPGGQSGAGAGPRKATRN